MVFLINVLAVLVSEGEEKYVTNGARFQSETCFILNVLYVYVWLCGRVGCGFVNICIQYIF